MLTVEQARARLAAKAEVDNAYAQATHYFLQSSDAANAKAQASLHQEGVQAAQRADSLAQGYYAQYPNCLSRNLNPWL